jgi:lactoylglutathione lyase
MVVPSPMSEVSELRVTLTVDDFDETLAFYRDRLGLDELADWSGEQGRVVLLGAGRGTLEIFDARQAAYVDESEAGRRISGSVRLSLAVPDTDEAAQRLADAGARARRRAGRPTMGRSQRASAGARRDAADTVLRRLAADF